MRTFVTLWVIAACMLVAFNAQAHAQRTPTRYAAVLRCAHIAEDSAAHVRLVAYGMDASGTLRIVYRCQRNGY